MDAEVPSVFPPLLTLVSFLSTSSQDTTAMVTVPMFKGVPYTRVGDTTLTGTPPNSDGNSPLIFTKRMNYCNIAS